MINYIEKLKKYITNVKLVINKIKNQISKKDYKGLNKRIYEIINLAESYVKDSEYYLYEKFDIFTSLCCIAYSEGLLDALRFLDFVNFEWPKKIKKEKVLIGGVFEFIHPGHLFLLKKGKELGEVIVIIARDSTVKKLKGREPIIPESQRLEVVRSLRYVDKAILGEENLNIEEVIKSIKPDVILLGPDQSWMEEKISNIIKKLSLNTKVIRLEKRYREFPYTSSSSIIRKVFSLNKSMFS